MIRRLTVVLLIGFAGVAAPCAAQTAAPSFDAAALAARAQSGDNHAAFELGTVDYVGLGVVQDYIGALRWLKQAAGAGDAEAACEVGFLYQTGSFAQGPPPPDVADAVPFYQQSAAAGNACGEFGLAALYKSGQGVAKDPVQADKLFAAAAAQGLVVDPASFPLQQLQARFYHVAYQATGLPGWQDVVSAAAGGGE